MDCSPGAFFMSVETVSNLYNCNIGDIRQSLNSSIKSMSTSIFCGWIGSSHLATPDLGCHVGMHEQFASLTLWCAAVSPSPSMHEQLKDFLSGSIILNCKLINCDKQLSHQTSSQDAEKTYHLAQVQSPWPWAMSSDVDWVIPSVATKTAHLRDLHAD